MKIFLLILLLAMLAIPSPPTLAPAEQRLVEMDNREVKIHAVTDLSHEFSFYADGRFHKQYLPGHKGVTNWCSLPNQDLSNANLLILLASNDRLKYTKEDVGTIKSFLENGGGVVIFGSEGSTAQNELLQNFGVEFTAPATLPLNLVDSNDPQVIEGNTASVLKLEAPKDWKIVVKDGSKEAVMVRKPIGKGNLLVSSRALAGSHPSAKDSINKDLWKPLLLEIASGKNIDPEKPFRGCGIRDLENKKDHGGFVLSYNDYLEPYAAAMVDVYKRSLPSIEKRMGVPLSPGMASHITLLATGGGGFSSGNTIGLAVWWGGFPDREDGMIEFLTHEAVHSWVLPYPEVWNEPIATYVGNLVMMDMGYKEEALKRIQNTIDRAKKHDPTMKIYDLQGNTIEKGKELSDGEKNDIHWGKSFWVLDQLRKENPSVISDYFKLKRQYAKSGSIKKYGMDETVALLSKAMKKDLFPWFNSLGITVDEGRSEI